MAIGTPGGIFEDNEIIRIVTGLDDGLDENVSREIRQSRARSALRRPLGHFRSASQRRRQLTLSSQGLSRESEAPQPLLILAAPTRNTYPVETIIRVEQRVRCENEPKAPVCWVPKNLLFSATELIFSGSRRARDSSGKDKEKESLIQKASGTALSWSAMKTSSIQSLSVVRSSLESLTSSLQHWSKTVLQKENATATTEESEHPMKQPVNQSSLFVNATVAAGFRVLSPKPEVLNGTNSVPETFSIPGDPSRIVQLDTELSYAPSSDLLDEDEEELVAVSRPAPTSLYVVDREKLGIAFMQGVVRTVQSLPSGLDGGDSLLSWRSYVDRAEAALAETLGLPQFGLAGQTDDADLLGRGIGYGKQQVFVSKIRATEINPLMDSGNNGKSLESEKTLSDENSGSYQVVENLNGAQIVESLDSAPSSNSVPSSSTIEVGTFKKNWKFADPAVASSESKDYPSSRPVILVESGISFLQEGKVLSSKQQSLNKVAIKRLGMKDYKVDITFTVLLPLRSWLSKKRAPQKKTKTRKVSVALNVNEKKITNLEEKEKKKRETDLAKKLVVHRVADFEGFLASKREPSAQQVLCNYLNKII